MLEDMKLLSMDVQIFEHMKVCVRYLWREVVN